MFFPILSHDPVLAELGQADLITNHDRERLSDPSAIVSVQCGKSSQELALTADVLSKFHRFKEESRFIAGELYFHSHLLACAVLALCGGESLVRECWECIGHNGQPIPTLGSLEPL